MFNFIDRFEKFILKDFFQPDFYQFMLLLSPMIASFAILLGGILSDRIGRKRVVIYGFVSLGIAYALIGIAPMALVSWYLYLVIDGVAAGILWVLFILILWGDLSQSGNREKYYVIGSIPFFLTDVISLPLAGYIRLIPANSSFSLASFFLFLAVLPLMYAPETLPERKIRLRQLKSYAEAAKKAKEKYLKKAGRG
jgi:MFS family permease